MRIPLALLAVIGLASCSRQNPDISAGPTIPHRSDRFKVTFAVVKLPNDDLLARGCLIQSINGLAAANPQEASRFAAYILDHKSEFALTEINGNAIPSVTTHRQTSFSLVPEAAQEARDFEKFGFKTEKFEASLDVRDEDDRGNLVCNDRAVHLIALKEQEGGSYMHGGDGSLVGPAMKVGVPEMGVVEIVKGNSLWAIYKLDRD